ncbi:hypothetical protein BDV18DRAFT_128053 [Aspergillus unguis]
MGPKAIQRAQSGSRPLDRSLRPRDGWSESLYGVGASVLPVVYMTWLILSLIRFRGLP